MRSSAAVGLVFALGVVGGALGCTARTLIDSEETAADDGSSDAPSAPPRIEESSKVDLLLVVDNSRRMVFPQRVLLDTVEYLLERLTDPRCVNGLGNVVGEPHVVGDPSAAPGSPESVCEVGQLDFPPITDLHIGVISTSLGGLGADSCDSMSGAFEPSVDDGARLLSRNSAGGVVPTYDNSGFLWWDPGGNQNPAGEADLASLEAKVEEIVRGVGARGCGFESQLESIYRFLVDPRPYERVTLVNGLAVPTGVDDVLLEQRREFLRPDSAVVALLISEEDDCSTRADGQSFLSRQAQDGAGGTFHLPRPRSECASDPDDPCCASCGAETPGGCPVDPLCESQPMLTALEDPLNLRCFDQKRRFGVDFLYPVDRYVRGFSELSIEGRDGQMLANPLFEGGRSPEMFLFAGILGVPWQDVAVDAGDLSTGYLRGDQIDYGLLLPDPETGSPPGDPLMVGSVEPRTGDHPLTGSPVAPPSSPSPKTNPINGHERELPTRDDLQYACIFEVRTPEDCTVTGCICVDPGALTDPACQAEDGTYSTVQRYAGAMPATRQLEVMRQMGERGVVASICAQNVSDASLPTFGYQPAVDAVVRTLRRRITRP